MGLRPQWTVVVSSLSCADARRLIRTRLRGPLPPIGWAWFGLPTDRTMFGMVLGRRVVVRPIPRSTFRSRSGLNSALVGWLSPVAGGGSAFRWRISRSATEAMLLPALAVLAAVLLVGYITSGVAVLLAVSLVVAAFTIIDYALLRWSRDVGREERELLIAWAQTITNDLVNGCRVDPD